MSDSCCCHGHCCGLDVTRLHLVLQRLNPLTCLYRLADGQGEGGGMGTITVPASLPSPEDDGHKLRKAFRGWGTDEKAIIDILGHRTAAQRSAIAAAYASLYGESLLDRLHSELSGDFRNAVMLWTMDPAERDAKLVNKALKRKGERHLWVIIEVACASSPDHLIAVRQAYCSLFASSIEEDVAHKITPTEPLGLVMLLDIIIIGIGSSSSNLSFLQLLVRLLTSYRYPEEHVAVELAKHEAAQLFDAVQKKQLHQDEVIRVLSTRNKSQLKETFEQYTEGYGRHIEEDIEGADRSQFASMLKAAIWCIASPEKHFAEVVRRSVVGLGTDEDSLTRAVVSRAEIDMKKVKEEYKKRYNTTLIYDVVDDTSGDYMRFLLTLIGPADA
ncbi:annexin D3-like isoform X1 [Musa acuminata AAA Group]|uniref:annexin D3-like isoform X1 n=1 Tax=Musa acuminata AAA Group TaxID=214697 RepID=UPI0031D276AD